MSESLEQTQIAWRLQMLEKLLCIFLTIRLVYDSVSLVSCPAQASCLCFRSHKQPSNTLRKPELLVLSFQGLRIGLPLLESKPKAQP